MSPSRATVLGRPPALQLVCDEQPTSCDEPAFGDDEPCGPGAVDGRSFDVAITDRGTTVEARVSLNEQGAPVAFSTTDRFMDDPQHRGRYVRAKWTTPVQGWFESGGRRLPSSVQAIWHPDGSEDLLYADFRIRPEGVAFNVAPGAAM